MCERFSLFKKYRDQSGQVFKLCVIFRNFYENILAPDIKLTYNFCQTMYRRRQIKSTQIVNSRKDSLE